MANPIPQKKLNNLLTFVKGKGNLRDIAIINTALSTLLRGGDLLNLKVKDVALLNGKIKKSFRIKMSKTKNIVLCGLDYEARTSLKALIIAKNKKPNAFIFTGRNNTGKAITLRHFNRILKNYGFAVGIYEISSHSLRKTTATNVYKKTKNLKVVQILLGHTDLKSTTYYLGIGEKQALKVLKKIQKSKIKKRLNINQKLNINHYKKVA